MKFPVPFRAAAALAILVSLTAATPTRDLQGDWSGKIQGALTLVLHVQLGAAGYTATLDSPDQGSMGMAIDTLAFAGDSLHFEMRRLQAAYAGRMSAGGDTLVGQWHQGGMTLPLSLARGLPAPVVKKARQETWPPYPYDTVAVSVPNPNAKGVTLAGTLTVPRGSGPFPAAVLITGSGPEDRDETIFGHRPFRVLADHLTRHGIAVLRLDDRGVGQSTGTFRDATSEDFASDALAAVAFLRGRKEIAPKKIGLIGHSEGGLIAPMAANRSHDVAFVVLMAGPGIAGDSILVLQSMLVRRSLGIGEEELARERAVMRRLYAAVRRGDSTAATAATHELVRLQLAGVPEERVKAMGGVDSIAAGGVRQMLSPWMRFFVTYDPAPALARLKIPVLALNGSKDLQVPPREDLDAIRAALARGGNHDAKAIELPGLNHLFQTAETGSVTEYARIDETIAPIALDTISDWIAARTGTPK
jgi:uncharacterized protein